MKLRISNPVLFSVCVGLFFLAARVSCEADGLKIEKLSSNGGYIETATVSFHDNRLYVKGWVRPGSWGAGRIAVKVDIKDAEGNVIATKTSSSLATGRPQLLKMFGVSYGVSFEQAETKSAAAVDVSYVN